MSVDCHKAGMASFVGVLFATNMLPVVCLTERDFAGLGRLSIQH